MCSSHVHCSCTLLLWSLVKTCGCEVDVFCATFPRKVTAKPGHICAMGRSAKEVEGAHWLWSLGVQDRVTIGIGKCDGNCGDLQ